jgi:hypothetical protein
MCFNILVLVCITKKVKYDNPQKVFPSFELMFLTLLIIEQCVASFPLLHLQNNVWFSCAIINTNKVKYDNPQEGFSFV